MVSRQTTLLLAFLLLGIIPSRTFSKSSKLPVCVPNEFTNKSCRIPIGILTCSAESENYRSTYKKSFDFKEYLTRTVEFLKILLLSAVHFPVGHSAPNSNLFLDVYIFSNEEEEQFVSIQNEIETWDKKYRDSFRLIHEKVQWPPEFEWMKDIYAPCVTYKLLLSKVLPDLDAIIYLDTDTLLTTNPRHLWDLFANFKPNNEFGMDQRFLDQDMQNPFNTEAVRALDRVLGQHSELNFNSGVVLWNLTRIREFGRLLPWINSLQKKKEHLLSDDMMIRSYILHYDHMPRFNLPCSWNYRIGFCDLKTKNDSVNLVHGMHGRFFKNGFPGCYYNAFVNSDLTQPSPNDVASEILNRITLCQVTCLEESDPQDLYLCQNFYQTVKNNLNWKFIRDEL